ncbi:hypothetical protein EAG14_00055 [Acidovorax sp. 1608163]|nr:hypothetical protein EAG14_00055 [Acidovorax sp. 1608163]
MSQKVPVSALRDKTVVVGVTAGPQAASWPVPGGATLHVSDVVAQSFVGLRLARAVTKPGWGHPVGWAAALVMALLVVVMPRAGKAVAWGLVPPCCYWRRSGCCYSRLCMWCRCSLPLGWRC